MAAESTFDVVSEFDRQELVNAIDQTQREVRTRYDLKDTKTEIVLGDQEVTITTASELHLKAVREILETRALRRGLSIKIFEYATPEEISGARIRQTIHLRAGISDEVAKKLQKLIRSQFPKVQPRIQGDTLRVGSKSKDELQQVIRFVQENQDDFPVPLQCTNYR